MPVCAARNTFEHKVIQFLSSWPQCQELEEHFYVLRSCGDTSKGGKG